jgi:hypothetical protein
MTGASYAAVAAALRRVRLPVRTDRRRPQSAVHEKVGPLRGKADQVLDPGPPASVAVTARGSPPGRTGQDKALPTYRHQVRVKGAR